MTLMPWPGSPSSKSCGEVLHPNTVEAYHARSSMNMSNIMTVCPLTQSPPDTSVDALDPWNNSRFAEGCELFHVKGPEDDSLISCSKKANRHVCLLVDQVKYPGTAQL